MAAIALGARTPRGWRPAFLRPYRYLAMRYLRTWRGTVTSSFLYPVLYLLAMGVGLGHLVNAHLAGHGGTARLGGVGYVQFLAPGIVVASAMQWGANESTYPVMTGFKWLRTYHAMLATPIEVEDLVIAQLAWVATRVAFSAGVFLGVLALVGDVRSALGVLVLPVAVLTGLAFAAPIAAFTATQDNDSGLSLMYRLGITPLFLFSGTFFPTSQLPGALQAVSRVTPLYHAVALSRALVLGRVSLWPALAHAGYLVVMLAVGTVLARRTYRKRMVV
jgi:lipooligosaccharide transport system permease protein